jgi:hypothetical protein
MENVENKKAFVFTTSGNIRADYAAKIKDLMAEKDFDLIEEFSCKGFDTWGPLKLIGGINKANQTKKT